jgi:predicted acetyltransferase
VPADCRPVTRADLDALWDLERRCFDVDPAGRARWETHLDVAQIHGVYERDRLVAMAQVIPFGQFFGGRSVPMGGVASVAVAPEARGRGYAARLVATVVAHMRTRGDAISTLFPATTSLYRTHGWEIAGRHARSVVAPDALRGIRPGRPVALRRARRDDATALAECYRRVARGSNGLLDRPSERWTWLLAAWDTLQAYVAEEDGRIAGYLVYRHVTPRPHHFAGFGIQVDEVLADDRDVLAALWALVGTSSTQFEDVIVRGSAADTLLAFLLPEPAVRTTNTQHWMLRIVDADAAVAARGFPPGVAAEVPLDVTDALVPENAGRWVLRVADGQGRLERGGDGTVRLDVGALATLYAGFATTATLARLARIAGGSEALRARLDACFAGPSPWIIDPF